MTDIISSLQLDLEEILNDLYASWQDNKGNQFNSTAFDKINHQGENIMFCCPYHEETKPSCGVLTEYPYSFNCFGCGAGGGLGQLVAYVMDLPNELYGLHYIQKHYTVRSAQDRARIDIESILSGGDFLSKKRTIPDEEVLKYSRWKHEYITKRGFSDRTVKKYEVGFDKESLSVTFPVRTSKGLVRFINRRSVASKMFLNEKNIFKKDILYGLCYLLQSGKSFPEIYLNESIMDTMSCYESGLPACALMGRILFKEQVKEMMLAGVKSVNLFLDNDKYGVQGTIKAYELITKLSAIRVNVVIYPGTKWGVDTIDSEEISYKDANDLLLSKMMRHIRVEPYYQYFTALDKDVREELVLPTLNKQDA